MDKKRNGKINGMCVAQSAVFFFGMYTVLTHYKENKAAILAMALIVVILVLLYLAEVLPRKGEGEMKSPTNDIPAAVGVWTIINLGLVVLMLVFAFDGLYELLRQLANRQ